MTEEQKILKELENNQIKKKRISLIHKVFISQLKARRKYTASTKTKAEVRGGGRKPWRQKGTGQARAGSIRSPLWVGGGTIFGPRKGRVVQKKVNKKERRLAIISAFYLKKNQTKIIDSIHLEDSENFQTKNFNRFLESLKIRKDEKTLIIIPTSNYLLWLSLRNLPNVELSLASCLNLKQLLNSKNILLSNNSVSLINETYGRKTKTKFA